MIVCFARQKDALEIARFIWNNLVLSRFLYTDLVPGKPGLEIFIEDIKQEKTKCSYTHCLVALDGEQIVGVANFYPSEEFLLTDEMNKRFSPEKIHYIAPLYQSPLPYSLYISALVIDPAKRGLGIGKALIGKIETLSHEAHREGISLHCWVDNILAMEFYKKLSFFIIEQLDLGLHALIPYNGKQVLLFK